MRCALMKHIDSLQRNLLYRLASKAVGPVHRVPTFVLKFFPLTFPGFFVHFQTIWLKKNWCSFSINKKLSFSTQSWPQLCNKGILSFSRVRAAVLSKAWVHAACILWRDISLWKSWAHAAGRLWRNIVFVKKLEYPMTGLSYWLHSRPIWIVFPQCFLKEFYRKLAWNLSFHFRSLHFHRKSSVLSGLQVGLALSKKG